MRKRSLGGSDFDLDGLVTLCHACHAQTDARYARGRLVVTPLGAGRFSCEVVRRPSKWERGNSPTGMGLRRVQGPDLPTGAKQVELASDEAWLTSDIQTLPPLP